MNERTPSDGRHHRAVVFNPGSNPNQVSRLRLINPGAESAAITIAGIDDNGDSPGGQVYIVLPAHSAQTISAAQLEAGGSGFDGALGDGTGKWRLNLASERPVAVLSLLQSPTGHLTNLSSAPGRDPGDPAP